MSCYVSLFRNNLTSNLSKGKMYNNYKIRYTQGRRLYINLCFHRMGAKRYLQVWMTNLYSVPKVVVLGDAKSVYTDGILGEEISTLPSHFMWVCWLVLLIPAFLQIRVGWGMLNNNSIYHCSLAKHKHRFQISSQKITSNFHFKRSVQMVVEDHHGDTKLKLVSQVKQTAHLEPNRPMNLL